MRSGKSHTYLSCFTAICISALAISGCSHAPQNAVHTDDQAALDADPFEPVNRDIYKFNYVVDGYVLKPVAQGYQWAVPEKGRQMVSNFLENLYTPVVFTNSVLQGDPQNSFATLWRFLLNTTFGVGGLFDFASAAGLKNRPADLGETMAFYGVEPGPFIELPIIGPSNVRDAFGRLGDAFISPANYISTDTSIAIWAATAIDARSRNMKLIDGVYDSSLDPYSTFRSGYTQKRASDIKRARAARDKALEHVSCK